jgi:Cu+-exporting ATPase
VGDSVIGGSINRTGTLLVRVTASGQESFLQRIARQVEDARALKPGILHLVDRVLVVYTPTVLAVALLAVLGWVTVPRLLGNEPDLQRAVFAGLSVLVMGYPCAVGISAPLPIVRGTGEAAERGILMRTGEAFQGYRLVTQIALDKTGILTEGKPRLIEIEASGIGENELIALGAGVEAASEHPLADAIVTTAFGRGLTPPEVEHFAAVPGKGVRARVDGATVLAGNPRFLTESGVDLALLAHRIEALESAGRTVVAVARDGRPVGLLAMGDIVRSGAAETVAALEQAGIRAVLITGDNERRAHRIAAQLGIDEVHAGILPGQKAQLVRELQQDGRVAMVGDGINDAPALMQANVGIAMGGGTDIAIDSADIIILSNRLDGVAVAREISRRSYRKMLQNVSLAFLFNGIGVPLAATGLIYPIWAMAAMAASVTTTFVNSLSARP